MIAAPLPIAITQTEPARHPVAPLVPPDPAQAQRFPALVDALARPSSAEPPVAPQPADPAVEPTSHEPAQVQPFAVDTVIIAMFAALPPAKPLPALAGPLPEPAQLAGRAALSAGPAPSPPADRSRVLATPAALAPPRKSLATSTGSDELAAPAGSFDSPPTTAARADPAAAPAAPVASQPSPATVTATHAAAPVAPAMLAVDQDGLWLMTLARDIAFAADPAAPLAFRLRPESLGDLTVELTRTTDTTSLRLTVETEAARSALVDGQSRLVADARLHGVRIGETHVLLSDHGAAHHGHRQHGEQHRPSPAPTGPQRTGSPDIANHPAPQTGDRYA